MLVNKSFWFVIQDKKQGEIKKYPLFRKVKDQGYKTAFWIHYSSDEEGKRMKNAIAIENIEVLLKRFFLTNDMYG